MKRFMHKQSLPLPTTATMFAPGDNSPLKHFSRRSGLRSLLTIAMDWSLIVIAAATCELLRVPGFYFVVVVVIARQMNALYELHHHAMHGNLFRKAAWNTRLQMLYSLPLGVTVTSERDDHMEHHRTYNRYEKDYQTWGEGYGLESSRRHDRRYMFWFICIRPFVGKLQLAEVIDSVWSSRWRSPDYRNAVAGFWIAVVTV